MNKKQQQQQKKLEQRQSKVVALRSYGLRVKDAKNQSRGEASALTKLYRKVSEAIGGSGKDRFDFVPNKKLSKDSKAVKKAKGNKSLLAIKTGVFVRRDLGAPKVKKDGTLVFRKKLGNKTSEESFVVPMDGKTFAISGFRTSKVPKGWLIRPMLDGRPSAQSFDVPMWSKEGANYISSQQAAGRKLTGFLISKMSVNMKVKGEEEDEEDEDFGGEF